MAMVGDAGKQPKKLRQFLLHLLDDSDQRNIIAWTDRDRGQFRLIKPEEVSSINLNLT